MAGHSVPAINAATGSNVTLKISKDPLGRYKRITWLHTPNQKILEYNYGSTKKIFESVFKGRVNLEETNGALHISNVRKEDRGIYYMRVMRETENELEITMEVFDPVPKPSIEIEKNESTDSCHLRLSCEVEDQSVDYTWYQSSGPFPQKSPGYELQIIVTPQNKSTFYTCQVSNPVSSKNDTVYFTLPCNLGKNPGS